MFLENTEKLQQRVTELDELVDRETRARPEAVADTQRQLVRVGELEVELEQARADAMATAAQLNQARRAGDSVALLERTVESLRERLDAHGRELGMAVEERDRLRTEVAEARSKLLLLEQEVSESR